MSKTKYMVTYEVMQPAQRVTVEIEASNERSAMFKVIDGEGEKLSVEESMVTIPRLIRIRHVENTKSFWTQPLSDFLKKPNSKLVQISD
jgi:hypothetical protein|tara:strand:- start:9617 stop:9883 length:267 start_codon:yes stop_codon:yes gene_type:complete